MADLERVKERYLQFAEEECKGYSDAYFQLAREIAGDERLLRFIAGMPEIQPNLLLASIQFLTGPQRMPQSGPDLRDFVEARRHEITLLMHTRRTQTNEPGRCATILPALPPGPLALLEVGASAGLCLLIDQYACQYDDVRLGPPDSPVRVRCRTTGRPPLPESLPKIAWRCGLDLNPLDIHDERDVRWLRSLIWPEHEERRARLAAAIDVARARPPDVRQGNLAADLQPLVAEAPADATLVVFHTAVLVYASPAEQQAFVKALVDASRRRDIVWISNESAGVVPAITALAPPVRPFQKLLGRTRFHRGGRHDELLAIARPHGAELHWLGDTQQMEANRLQALDELTKLDQELGLGN